jgi:hypothetical protein
MTAYFDESGTHGDSPTVIVAGFGATLAQWTGFEKRVRKLFGDFGIARFHAKDFRGTKGDFKGWDLQKKGIFNSRFLQIIDNQLSFAVAGITTPDEYLKHYREKRFPRGVRVDTIYGICFRTALLRATLDFENNPHDWPLNVVLELGHKNAQDAVRIFQEVKKRPQFAPLFGTIPVQGPTLLLEVQTILNRKPPLHTRFQKGQSGNPSGKPGPAKIARQRFQRALHAALEGETADLKDARPRVTLEAVVRRLTLDAANGNMGAVKLILRELDREVAREEPAPRSAPNEAGGQAGESMMQEAEAESGGPGAAEPPPVPDYALWQKANSDE